jgi:cell wall-associated NlpC family hydrolase
MNLKKIFFVSVCIAIGVAGFTVPAPAQQRERVVKPTSSKPTNLPPDRPDPEERTRTTSSSRPVLTSPIIVVSSATKDAPLVKRTVSSAATHSASALAAGKTVYSSGVSGRIMAGIQSRWGIPYRYGSTGPNTYDCSGFVWSVFNEAGVKFTRASAHSLWASSEPVSGDDRFKFGTLVFLNGLGHMGIVADENGFFHASSSKGITYSPFKGYWSSRIVGFRKLNPATAAAMTPEK